MPSTPKTNGLSAMTPDLFPEKPALPTSSNILERIAADVNASGGPLTQDPELEGAIGTTMFDLPGSEDNTLTVLLPRQQAQVAGSQSLVRIKSRKGGDGRIYLGMVKAGPFA